MTPEQQKYIDEMEFLFGQQGWKNLVEDIQIRQKQERDNLLSAKTTAHDVTVAFGRNEVYQYLLSLEPTLQEVKRMLVNNE